MIYESSGQVSFFQARFCGSKATIRKKARRYFGDRLAGGRAGWRIRRKEARGKGEGFTFEQASDSLLQSLWYRRSQTLRCEYVTATEYRLRPEYREEGKKKSRTTSFLRAMIVEERGRDKEKVREEGEGSPSNSYPALMLLELLRSVVAGDPFSIARETSREIEISFSLGPPTLFGLWLRESYLFSSLNTTNDWTPRRTGGILRTSCNNVKKSIIPSLNANFKR